TAALLGRVQLRVVFAHFRCARFSLEPVFAAGRRVGQRPPESHGEGEPEQRAPHLPRFGSSPNPTRDATRTAVDFVVARLRRLISFSGELENTLFFELGRPIVS